MNMNKLVEKLSKQKKEQYATAYEKGKEDAIEDAENYDLSDFEVVEKIANLDLADGELYKNLKNDLEGGFDEWLDKQADEWGEIAAGSFFRGWIDGVMEVWNEVKDKI